MIKADITEIYKHQQDLLKKKLKILNIIEVRGLVKFLNSEHQL